MRRSLLALIIAILALFMAGCSIVDQSRVPDDDHDRMPWNTRAGWEDTGMGVPF